MIGVIPEPAEMKRIRSGRGSGSTNSPSTSERKTIAPGFSDRLTNGVTVPSGTSFGVIEMKPSGRPGSEVSE